MRDVTVFRLRTHHNSILYYDRISGEVRHRVDGPANLFMIDFEFRTDLLVIEPGQGCVASLQRLDGRWTKADLYEAGAPQLHIERIDARCLAIRDDRAYLSALADGGTAFFGHCEAWEWFTLEPASALNAEFWRRSYPTLGRELPKKTTPHYAIVGPLDTFESLATVGRRLALILDREYPGRTSVYPRNDMTKFLHRLSEAENEALMTMQSRIPDRAAGPWIVIHHGWPPSVPVPRGDVNLAYFFWEESLIPPEIVQTLNLYDGVLAPSRFVAEAAIASGVKKRVHYIGYAPDLSAYRQIFERRRNTPRPSESFTFLHVSSGQHRKGVDALLTAYAKAFTANDKVKLIIKSAPVYTDYIRPKIDKVRADFPHMAEIQWILHEMEYPDLLNLYYDADAMVLPTRGEGFNIPAAEAIAAGLNLIVTGHSGQMDFCTPDIARLIKYDMVPAEWSEHRVEGSRWAEPDVADLKLAMREIFETRPTLSITGREQMLETLSENALKLRLLQAVTG